MAEVEGGKPNLLLITTDQQRFDAAGSAGPSFLRTPHVQLLEHEGITYTSAYSDCPICVPARVTIMTGRPAYAHGLTRNGRSSTVMGDTETLPARLAQLGYQTAAIGKMHFGPQRVRHGFHEMILPDDYYREMAAGGRTWAPMRHGLGQLELYPGMATVPEAMTLTAWTADRCVDYIRYRRDPSKPFFLWCSYAKPHPPLDPPEPYYSMYRNESIPDPVTSDWSSTDACPPVFRRIARRRRIARMSPATLREARAAYYGLVTHIDYTVGRLFAALQDSRLWDNTLILYTSDHGEFLGDHGNGGKLFFHEPSAHIPFVVRPPLTWRNRNYPSTVRTPVTLADVMPTLLAAAGGVGAPVPEAGANDGEATDVLELALKGDQRRPAVGVGGYESPCDYLAITDGSMKYIYYPEGPTEQLFDLSSDPEERVDLLSSGEASRASAETISRLRQELVSRISRYGEPFISGGALPVRERQKDGRLDERSALYSFHTDDFDGDVRH